MARRKKTKHFKVGHIVRHTREFLRNTGMQVGAPINGQVVALAPGFAMGPDRGMWPVVRWSNQPYDAPPQMINPANIELDPRARKINEQVGFGGFGETFVLEFLPYITPEFPRFQGSVEEAFPTQRAAERRMRSLIRRGVIEQARLRKQGSHWTLKMWDADEGWIS